MSFFTGPPTTLNLRPVGWPRDMIKMLDASVYGPDKLCMYVGTNFHGVLADKLESMVHLSSLSRISISIKRNREADFAKLVGALGRSTYLRNVQELEILGTVKDISVLAEMLERSPHFDSIVKLNITKSGIGTKGVEALFGGSGTSLTNLIHLDLSNNPIGPDGVSSLVCIASRCPQLEILNLGGAKLGDKGTAVLADMLASFTNLRQLLIPGNLIGREGAASIAGILQDTNLELIAMYWNMILQKGCDALVSVYEKKSYRKRAYVWVSIYEDEVREAYEYGNCQKLQNISRVTTLFSVVCELEGVCNQFIMDWRVFSVVAPFL